MDFRSIVDKVIEAPVVTSFTRVGYGARKALDGWQDLDEYDLSGKVMLVTGGTSGLGYAAALQLAECGAQVVIVGRSEDKNVLAAETLATQSANPLVDHFAADMGELEQVDALADYIGSNYDRLDVLAHNAGALSAERRTNSAGIEATVASQVVGPHRLTTKLLPLLAESDGRVLTMSSGGMYAAGLAVGNLQMGEDEYNGTEQYARAKRAQVTLNEMWPDIDTAAGVTFHAVHPGWADTPGVSESLPTFSKVLGPLLRTPEQGADSLVWLAADDEATQSNGKFWLDRRIRTIHKTPFTKKTDTPERRAALWDAVENLANA